MKKAKMTLLTGDEMMVMMEMMIVMMVRMMKYDRKMKDDEGG
jgi:hypothetical protein